MENKTVTISISVNIASGDKWEGSAEFAITIPAHQLHYLNAKSFSGELAKMITDARADYFRTNANKLEAAWTNSN